MGDALFRAFTRLSMDASESPDNQLLRDERRAWQVGIPLSPFLRARSSEQWEKSLFTGLAAGEDGYKIGAELTPSKMEAALNAGYALDEKLPFLVDSGAASAKFSSKAAVLRVKAPEAC